jgi:hypothetical protein
VSDAVQLTESREILLNIVRLRFGDPIQFIQVNQINASFSVNVGASGNVSNIGGVGPNVGSLSSSVGYDDSHTETYTNIGTTLEPLQTVAQE